MPDWNKRPHYSEGSPRKWYWLAWMLFGFAIAAVEFLAAWKYIHKRAALVCILLSFFGMQMLEGFATLKGIWIWNDQAIIGKIGNIPISEWGVYIMAPMVAVGSIEFARRLLMRFYERSTAPSPSSTSD